MSESSYSMYKRMSVISVLVAALLVSVAVVFFIKTQSVAADNGGGPNMFLKIDGISGDSQDQNHTDENEVKSFSWQETTVNNNKGGGGGAGIKSTFGDLSVEMKAGNWSPTLLQYAASGNHIKEVNLHASQPGGGYVKIKLQDVVIDSYGTIGSDKDASIMDQVSFSYSKIYLDTMSVDGSTGSIGWDVRGNKKL